MINEKGNNNPGGLNSWDTLEDTFKRADKLAPPDGRSHSGKMFSNKDLRRIVLLVREYRKLEAHYKPRVKALEEAGEELPKFEIITDEKQECFQCGVIKKGIVVIEFPYLCQHYLKLCQECFDKIFNRPILAKYKLRIVELEMNLKQLEEEIRRLKDEA